MARGSRTRPPEQVNLNIVGPHQAAANTTKVTTTTKDGSVKKRMSHSVTITRTTTTTSSSAILVNTGYFKTGPGLLKLAEVIIAGVILGIVAYYKDHYYYGLPPMPKDFMLVVSTTVFVASFCLLFSCLISLATASFISKTIYEVVYHLVAFALTLAASITLLVEVNRYSRNSTQPFLVASILGLILSALYLLSTILAFRSYRGA